MRLHFRHCHHLLRGGKLESAYAVAVRLKSASLLKVFPCHKEIAECWQDLATWSINYEDDMMRKLALDKAYEIDSNAIPDYPTKKVIGADQIGSYMRDLEESYKEGEKLDDKDATRLGLWLENQAKYKEALQFYMESGMATDYNRLQSLMEGLRQIEIFNLD